MQEADSRVVAVVNGVNVTQHKANLFWSKVDRQGPNDCWPYLGGKHYCKGKKLEARYGQFHIGTRKTGRIPVLAHRIAYLLGRGPFNEKLLVRHAVCGKAICCNPAHLEAGTHLENYADSVRMGTVVVGKAGEQSILAKLTSADVLKIREMRKTGMLYRIIGAQFGVTWAAVRDIVIRRNWKHLKSPLD